MIASVFSKTRPINYLLIGFFIVISFIAYIISKEKFNLDWLNVINQSLFLGLIIASTVLVNFISLKNDLTKNNTYAAFLFFTFMLFFPSIFENKNILISNFLLLLALRRLISLKSMISTKEKIFDASFWIFLSALFHFWSVFYIILVFISIILDVSRDFKNWLIPFIALFTVIILFFLFNEILDNSLYERLLNKTYIGFNFSYFENVYQNLALAIFTSISLLLFVSFITGINKKMLNMQTSYKKILFSFVLGVGIYILSANKNNGYLAFSLAPLAIIGANFLEDLKTNWVKETTLYIFFFLGVFFFITQL
ncbi:DUF6427 family protein [Flavobacterium sp.]|jgi:hypothetical protein|uniref:DUF6427 family protein n=1 Tax=Flavobacterium sp. TaxID=239 RepID=UPI002A827868|nr:DUF6427 family protein [Flavobacterium sp.]